MGLCKTSNVSIFTFINASDLKFCPRSYSSCVYLMMRFRGSNRKICKMMTSHFRTLWLPQWSISFSCSLIIFIYLKSKNVLSLSLTLISIVSIFTRSVILLCVILLRDSPKHVSSQLSCTDTLYLAFRSRPNYWKQKERNWLNCNCNLSRRIDEIQTV